MIVFEYSKAHIDNFKIVALLTLWLSAIFKGWRSACILFSRCAAAPALCRARLDKVVLHIRQHTVGVAAGVAGDEMHWIQFGHTLCKA